jgi:class 3 adenylate cyclase/tetratricopeptide (TPR) repeat protein
VAARPPGRLSAEERKVVTVLFCDLASSSELSGLIDTELLRTILLRYYALMQEQVEGYGGTVEKFIGDAVMAVFGLLTREDDAHRALLTALAMLDAVAGLNRDLERDYGLRLDIRIGVHTGEVVTTADPGSRQALVSGQVVNIAARLQQAAAPGQIVISAATRLAAGSALKVTSAGPLSLRGIREPVEAFRLVSVGGSAPDGTRRFDVPFVGRERDLSALDLTWGRVVAQGDAHLLTVLGEAGMGKTRLVAEWLKRRRHHVGVVGSGRCRSSRAGGSLIALADCVAPLIAEVETDTRRADTTIGSAVALLQTGLLLDGAPSPSNEETRAAVESVLAAVASQRPVLLVVDDFHWAGSPLVEMLQHLMEHLDRLPVMLACLARPEFIDAFPGWGSGRANASTVTMAGLAADEAARLAASYIDVAAHDHGIASRLVAQADGNPLYLEQLGAAAGEQGTADQHLPPGLQALLAARIDRLSDAERTALRYAAVIGREFAADDLRWLAGDEAMTASGGYIEVLRSLARRRLISPMRGPFGVPGEYEFANAVMQRVAYEGLTKHDRGELHERYAQRLVLRQCSGVLIGEHLEQAYRYRTEVGMIDDEAAALRGRAAGHLARAGTFALRRADFPRALALLQRAVSLTDRDDPGRPEYLLQSGAASLTIGRVQEAEQALREALAEAGDNGLPGVAAHARLLLAAIHHDHAAQEEAARDAVPIFTASGDDLGLARSLLILARSCQRRGRHAEALRVLDRATVHSVSAGADQELANTLGATGMSLWRGPVAVPTAIDRCVTLLAAHGAERAAVRATLGFPLTVLYAVHGRRDQAGESLAVTHRAMDSISYAGAQVFRPLLAGLVALAGGQDPVAEAALREALDAARTMRDTGLVRGISLELARLRLSQSRWPEAAELVDGLPAGEDAAERASELGIRACFSAVCGDPGQAADLAGAALRVARGTDSPAVQAIAFLDRARTAIVLGRRGPARAAASAALRRFTAKGDLTGIATTERLLSGGDVGGR